MLDSRLSEHHASGSLGQPSGCTCVRTGAHSAWMLSLLNYDPSSYTSYAYVLLSHPMHIATVSCSLLARTINWHSVSLYVPRASGYLQCIMLDFLYCIRFPVDDITYLVYGNRVCIKWQISVNSSAGALINLNKTQILDLNYNILPMVYY